MAPGSYPRELNGNEYMGKGRAANSVCFFREGTAEINHLVDDGPPPYGGGGGVVVLGWWKWCGSYLRWFLT